jgi:hypothetical protein
VVTKEYWFGSEAELKILYGIIAALAAVYGKFLVCLASTKSELFFKLILTPFPSFSLFVKPHVMGKGDRRKRF